LRELEEVIENVGIYLPDEIMFLSSAIHEWKLNYLCLQNPKMWPIGNKYVYTVVKTTACHM